MFHWTFVMYLAAGACVAWKLFRQSHDTGLRKAAAFCVHWALWPLFLPLLLPTTPALAPGAYARRIEQAERHLRIALDTLGKDLEDPLSVEGIRVRALGQAMHSAAQRIADLDALLAAPENAEGQPSHVSAVADILEEKRSHIQKLHAFRRQAETDLERAMARAAELSARVTLLRYEAPHGATAADVRARELTESIEELCQTLNAIRAEPPDHITAP